MSKQNENQAPRGDLSAALASPQRLELIGLYVEDVSLSISDMAQRVGRPATSLYHHVQVLVDAGVLMDAGTRPKGKRFETLFKLTRERLELDVEEAGEEQMRRVAKAMSAGLRMADRDFAAALERDDLVFEGPGRNLAGTRMIVRADAEGLARINEKLKELEDLALEAASSGYDPGPDAQFLSFTLVMSPLRGRRIATGSDEYTAEETS